jgi:hypothetical protein
MDLYGAFGVSHTHPHEGERGWGRSDFSGLFQTAVRYRRGNSRPFSALTRPRSGASSVKGTAVFFSDFGCFGFLVSRLDLLCPFAITGFLTLII